MLKSEETVHHRIGGRGIALERYKGNGFRDSEKEEVTSCGEIRGSYRKRVERARSRRAGSALRDEGTVCRSARGAGMEAGTPGRTQVSSGWYTMRSSKKQDRRGGLTSC